MIAYRTDPDLHTLLQQNGIARAFWEISVTAAVLVRAGQAARRLSVASIQAAVCTHFGLKPMDMQTARRARVIARPRQVAMYLCRELTPRSLPEIGRRFGGRDHTTVMHACRQVAHLRSTDPAFDADVSALERELGG